jgi:hypothetical protein
MYITELVDDPRQSVNELAVYKYVKYSNYVNKLADYLPQYSIFTVHISNNEQVDGLSQYTDLSSNYINVQADNLSLFSLFRVQ